MVVLVCGSARRDTICLSTRPSLAQRQVRIANLRQVCRECLPKRLKREKAEMRRVSSAILVGQADDMSLNIMSESAVVSRVCSCLCSANAHRMMNRLCEPDNYEEISNAWLKT